MRGLALLLVLSGLAGGCASNWERHDESLYATLQNPSPETFAAHAELLAKTIQDARDQDRRPPAGVCAEYAYYAARLGRKSEVADYLALERQYYPEAATFLTAYERFLAGVTPVTQPGGEAPSGQSSEDGQ